MSTYFRDSAVLHQIAEIQNHQHQFFVIISQSLKVSEK